MLLGVPLDKVHGKVATFSGAPEWLFGCAKGVPGLGAEGGELQSSGNGTNINLVAQAGSWQERGGEGFQG